MRISMGSSSFIVKWYFRCPGALRLVGLPSSSGFRSLRGERAWDIAYVGDFRGQGLYFILVPLARTQYYGPSSVVMRLARVT